MSSTGGAREPFQISARRVRESQTKSWGSVHYFLGLLWTEIGAGSLEQHSAQHFTHPFGACMCGRLI